MWRIPTDAEVRFRLVGLTARGQLVTVAFTFRGNRIRIISARPASSRKQRAMKQEHAEARAAIGDGLDAELDVENAEFDFSQAPRPGRNELFERAQGHFHDAPDAEDPGPRAAPSGAPARGRRRIERVG